VPLQDLHAYIASTEAAALVDPASEKTALSIRITASTYARALRYVPHGGKEFHLRDWVHGSSSDSWVFLNSNDEQLASVRPLLSLWLEILTNALLGLRESRDRRVWLVIDELPALQKIPSISNYLARGRKNGGCGVMGFQVFSQLRDMYGQDDAQSLAGLCSTWLCLGQRDPDTARWIAQSFGQVEVVEASQGLSYGANDMRDGVSLSNQRKTRPLLLDAELLTLPDFCGYLRTKPESSSDERLPAIQVRFKYRAFKTRSPEYIERKDLTDIESDGDYEPEQRTGVMETGSTPTEGDPTEESLAEAVTEGPLVVPPRRGEVDSSVS
jgi:hypothetical protein